ncbi:hypothetical protein [Aquimarina megaterium]|uniref:hypothetical protein n=1 Tax=Aquimarina megaterium TaxID=1443666 RepID=UPI0004705E1E|nr:hypothetical protein [Aquimarina megaterium]
MEFKSYILELKIILILITILGLGLTFGIETELINIDLSSIFILLTSAILFVGVYCYYAIMNNNFILNSEEMLIINRFLFFKREEKIRFDKIKSIIFRDDTSINMFSGYKWIEIKYLADSLSLKSKKVYCNGMEYDAFDENINFPTFDEFFDELERRGLNIKWTK